MTLPEPPDAHSFAVFTRNNLIAWGLLSCSLGIVVAAFITYVVPIFEASFNGFGAEVPSLTMLVIHSRHALWTLPAGSAVLFCVGMRADNSTPTRHARIVLILGIWCVLILALGATAVISLYSPIREMGASI